MRVLLVCTVYPPEVAPAGVMTRELAEDLVASGHDVTVLTGWPNYPEGRLFPGYRQRFRDVRQENGYRVVRVWHTLPQRKSALSRILWFVSFAVSSFLNILRCRELDVVYAHSTPVFGAPLTYLACWLKGARYVYGIYDIYPEAAAEVGAVRHGLVYRTCRRLDTWVCRRAASIPTLSEGQRRTLMARGLPQEKIAIIPFWLDAERHAPLPRVNDWRRENGIEPDKFVVLYAGTIGRISGAGMMVDVAAALADQPRLLLLFVGEGVAKDEIQRRSREMGLTNVRFLPFQPAERLAQVQATADVGVVTLMPGSGRHSIPSKMLGYMAAGRGVVAGVDSDSDTAAAIQQAGCGLVVPSQDVGGMVQAIRRAMEPGVAEQWGRAAREQFLARYSRSANSAKYVELLQGVCLEDRPGRGAVADADMTYTTPLGRQITAIRTSPVKRVFDFTVALVGLIAMSPLLAIVAILVKLTSRGPVFYRDERFGLGGTTHWMLKFRSMKAGAPPAITADGKLVVDKRDPRLTPIGRYLRALHLDEIPQLINVLIGDMSLVGPRSGQPKYESQYDDLAYERLRVRPGMTGLGAVVGGRHLTNQSLYAAEARYVQRQSLWLDLLIILATPVYIFLGVRASRRLLRRYLKGLELQELADTSET